MSRASDEVHNSEVEECNLISSPTAVFFESRFPSAQTRRSIDNFGQPTAVGSKPSR
jgi:hypothetical protein